MKPIRQSMRAAGFVMAGCVLLALSGCGGNIPGNVSPDLTQASSIREKLDAGGGGGGVEVADPTGWATLAGRFTLDGDPPSPTEIIATGADKNYCESGGALYDRSLQVDSATRGVQSVVLFLKSRIPKEKESLWINPEITFPEPAVIDQKLCLFTSSVFTMHTSQSLVIKNSDARPHNTNIDGGPNLQIASNSETTVASLKATGVPTRISCAIHPWMASHLLVQKQPYFAATAKDGTFTIDKIPAGVELEFMIWQPAANVLSDKYVASAKLDGKDVKISNGKVKVNVAPGATANLDVTLSASAFQ